MGRARDPHARNAALEAGRSDNALRGPRSGGDPLTTATRPADRIAVPFWNGLLTAIAAIAIAALTMFVVTILLIFAVVLATGRMPSLNPGHPLVAATEAAGYACSGWFAWTRLRATGLRPFRALTRRDVRAILIGVTVLLLARIATGVQLILTHQTKHVQTGFQHFDVVTSDPATTMIGAGIGVASMVLLAPVVEETVFRGLLFGALAPRLGILASALVTAVLFGALHGDLVLFPLLAVLGLINALAYAATANLWVPITLHALSNLIGAIALIATSLQHR